MRIVNDNDTRTFTDHAGDTLTLLSVVRQRDAEKASKLETDEAMEGLKALGISMDDAMRQARETSPEEQAAARARMNQGGKSLTIRRFRLEAVAKALCVAGQTYGGNAVLDAYDSMDPESAAWVDAQVNGVWESATPDDAARES